MMTLNNLHKRLLPVILLAMLLMLLFVNAQTDEQFQQTLMGDDQLVHAGLGDSELGVLDAFVESAANLSNFTNISVTKVDSPDPVLMSSFLNYTIFVNSTGNGTAFNVTVNDTYPNQSIFLTSQPPPLTGTNNTFILGNLTPGTSFAINISLLTTNITNNLTVNNSVNASFQNETSQGFQSRNISINTTIFVPPPIINTTNITITKIDSPDPVNANNLLNYTIMVNVTGNGTAFNVTVNDTYPPQVTYLSSQPDPLTGTNNSWVLGNLTLGTSFSINVTVNVTTANDGVTINNTANATFQNETSQALVNRSSTQSTLVLVPFFNVTNLTVTKTDSPDSVNASGVLNYTIFVNVTGNGTAYNVTVNDTYPNQTIFISSQPTALTGTNNTWILGNLTAGTNFSINISMLVNNVTNNLTINNSVNASFQNETSQGFQSVNISINTSVNNFTGFPLNISNLSVAKTDSVDPAIISTLLNYTINVTSTGRNIAHNVTVNDTYPNEIIFQSASPAPLTGTNNTWILGNLSPDTSIIINVTVMLNNISGGAVINNTVNTTFQNATGAILSIVRTESTIAQGEITGCPVVINTTTRLAQELRTNTSCIIINASHIDFNCDGYRIIGNHSGLGINITRKENVTIRNCLLENFTNGAIFDRVNETNYINNTHLNNYSEYSQNLRLIGSTNNTLNNMRLTHDNNNNNNNNNNNLIFSDENSTNNSITNATFETLNGSIQFPGTIQFSGIQNISNSEHISIGTNNHSAFVHAGNLSFLNTSSEITLNGITLVDPTPTVDFEDDGTFAPCPASVCTEVSYANGMFRFNVTHFTTFSSSEGDPNVTLTKSDGSDPATAGTSLTYTIIINNTGTANASNLTLTETYPNQTTFDSSQPSPLAGTNNIFVIGNLTQGQVFSVNITTLITSVPNIIVINNTANISFTNASNAQINVSVTENTTINPAAAAPSGGGGSGGATGIQVIPTPITPPSVTQPTLNQTMKEQPANITLPNVTKEHPATISKPTVPDRKPLPEITPKPRKLWTPTHVWLSIATILVVLLPLAIYIIASRTNSTARRRREIFSPSTRLARLKNCLRTAFEAVYEAIRVMLLILTILALILHKQLMQFLKLTSHKLVGRLKEFIVKLTRYFKKPPRITITPQERVRTLEEDAHKLQQLGFKIKGISVQQAPKPAPLLPVTNTTSTTTKPTPVAKPRTIIKEQPRIIQRKTLPDETLNKLFNEIEQVPTQPEKTIERTPEPAEHAPEPISERAQEPEHVETPVYPEPAVIYQVEHAQEPQRVEPEKTEPSRIVEETPTPALTSKPKPTERFITPTVHSQDKKTMLEQLKETYALDKKTSTKKMLDQLKEAYLG